MGSRRMRLFANNVTVLCDDGTYKLLLSPARRVTQIMFGAAFVLPGIASIYGVSDDLYWLAAGGFLLCPILPFFVLSLGDSQDHTEAYIDELGVTVVFKAAGRRKLNVKCHVSAGDIKSVVVEAHVWRSVRLGSNEWRQYRIYTHESGDRPAIKINTGRPLSLIVKDFSLFKEAPWLSDIPVLFFDR